MNYTAIIDSGEEVETIGGVETYLQYHRNGVVELYQEPTKKRSVDTHLHRVIIKQGPSVAMVFENGEQRVRL